MYVADMPGSLFWKYLPAHLMANLVFLVYYSLRGKTRAAWRAKLDGLRGLPLALRRRRLLQSTRRVSLSEIDRQLDHGWFGPYLLGRTRRRIERASPRSASIDARER
jgi:hypothetical protein